MTESIPGSATMMRIAFSTWSGVALAIMSTGFATLAAAAGLLFVAGRR